MASPDLRIIIVSWNVEQHLRRCLASLPEACKGIDYETIVVDNNSKDNSVAIAEKTGVTVIANNDNKGFARACNQGIKNSDARYILLLNPDTECPPGSLTKLVAEADRHPRAGIFGPKLLNIDGSTQDSIRGFPTFWSQVGVLCKLHNFFPWLFRRYLAKDRSHTKEQDVDQVMGACFLIRRELINDIGPLDERYFTWFEEVDYCRTAKKHGWSVRYLPSVVITHHGGQSFGQLFAVHKQKRFNDSLIKYAEKWFPKQQANILKALQPISLALAWLVGRFPYSAWIIAILGFEILSRATIFNDTANAITTIVIGLLVGVITLKRPTLGLTILALELLIGSHGRLFQLWGWPGAISLRMMLFAAFFMGWGAKTFWRVDILHILKKRWEWVLVALALVYGVIMGFVQGSPAVLAEANAWIYALLLIPVIHLARTQSRCLAKNMLPVLIIGPIWLALKAIGIEYLFAHGLAVVDPPTNFYLWIRRTGVGEVTPLTPVIHRVFMQSQVFALPALLFGVSYYFTTHEKGFSFKHKKTANVVLLAAIIALIIGYSRSIWIGAAAGLLTLVAFNLKNIVRILKTAVRGIALTVIAFIILAISVIFPIPSAPGLDHTSAVTNRIGTTDAAASSRWELLSVMQEAIVARPFLGYGIGTALTYHSSDPRILARDPGGTYTTAAFEWGWLAHWFQLGFFGLLAVLILVIRLALRIVHSNATPWTKNAALASLIALVVTHYFTPYLNHPLGLGYLIALEAWCTLYETRDYA